MSATASLCGDAIAQQAVMDQSMAFNIPAQTLDNALAQYFQATGVQLLYDSALTHGQRSTGLHGRYSAREALRILLDGTGLIIRYSRANAAIITRADDLAQDGPLIPLGRVIVRERVAVKRLSPVERIAYYQQIEMELQTLLLRDHRTSRLDFRILVQLRIEEDGRIDDIKASRGSGDRQIDRAVMESLKDATLSPPPPPTRPASADLAQGRTALGNDQP
ncbi:MAG TPA: TonB family protein [Sphingobium sp.]|uniref:TonB family protein n=1 Tax=Sphingobium sp. TaxID=1912891 RepID=UPI002ED3EAEE